MPGSVSAAEVKSERKLARRNRSWSLPVTALNTDAAINLKAGIVFRTDKLRRNRPLVRDPVLGGIVKICGWVVDRERRPFRSPVIRRHPDDARAADQVIRRRHDA